jgi:hypothetical protein
MAWVSSGTVSVTNGSTTVTGTGTSWFGAMQNGWGFVGPDGRVYEILTVDSADTITLKTPYQGSTAAAQVYAVFPTGSHNLDLTAALQQLLSDYQGVYDTVGQGRFPGEVVFDADRDTGMGNPSANELGLKAGDVWQLLLKGGQASGAAVQSSLSDTTAGKLMLNGAHGLGAVAGVPAPGYDADQCLTPGFNYRFTTAGVNTPVSNPFGGTLQVFSGSAEGTDLVQVYVQRTASGMWMRGTTDGVNWTAWSRVYHTTNILGTVSQSGGVPTGALFEWGGNANGEYIRLANGTQICISNVFTADATTPVGALYKWASNQTWAFPAAFAAVPSVTPGATNNTSLTATCATTTTTDVAVNVLNALSVAGRSASFIAIGRWF